MQINPLTENAVHLDGITLDLENGWFVGSDKSQYLRPLECRLLQVLMQQVNQVVTRASLMKEVWQTDYLDDTRTLDVHICLLRRKIEPDPRNPQLVRTVRGVGYRFCT